MGRLIHEGYLISIPDKVFQEAEKDFDLLIMNKKLEEAYVSLKAVRTERNRIWGIAMLKAAGGSFDLYEKRKL